MPIYAYRCSACGHAKDVLQKLSDAPLTRCPACGEDSFAKQLTAAGFQLKGSGWYVTDFRNGNKGQAKPAAAGDKGGDDGAGKGGDKPADKGGEKGAAPAAAESGSSGKDQATPAAPAKAGTSTTAGPSSAGAGTKPGG